MCCGTFKCRNVSCKCICSLCRKCESCGASQCEGVEWMVESVMGDMAGNHNALIRRHDRKWCSTIKFDVTYHMTTFCGSKFRNKLTGTHVVCMAQYRLPYNLCGDLTAILSEVVQYCYKTYLILLLFILFHLDAHTGRIVREASNQDSK